MVWERMGLLDDAIRDHLELKRRRGADPGEVAREQHEALEPVFRGESASPTDAMADPMADASQAVVEGSATVAQETQELDMETVLEQDDTPEPARPEMSGQPRGDTDWPDELVDDPEVPREIPGQERLSFE
jgi:hypothetical protein